MSQVILTQKLMNDFLENLQAQQQSKAVVAEYRRNLSGLKQITERNQGILDQEILSIWNQEQKKQGLAPGTITNRKVRINRFLRYIGCEDLCFQNGGRRNLAGMQFGDLTVIEPTERRSQDRSVYWKCRCTACGKEKEIPANQLTRGVQISCGCRRAGQLQKTNGYIDGTCLKNVFSDKVNRNNTSGYKGVFLKRGKWTAQIQYKKKTYYLGSYENLEDAVAVRKEAENRVRDDAEKLLEQLKQEMQN